MDNDERPKIDGVIYQYDKRSKITYAYENHPYVEKVTGKHKSTRKLIGRYDPVTKTIVPTDGRRKRKEQRDAAEKKAAAVAAKQAADADYKALYENLLKTWTSMEARISALESEVRNLKKHLPQ